MHTPKVLLVNDDSASLYALESLLLDAANQDLYELIKANSGQEALRQVLRHEFAVILMDVSMPGMDGFETAEAIHSHPRSAGVPIIFITAHYADEINRLKAYQKGAADYLFTPIIPPILQAKVAVFVEMSKKNIQLRIKSEQLARLNQDLRVQRLQDLERINAELELEIKERKQAEQRAHELSTRDPLTNLLNRRALIQQLEHAVASSDRSGTGFALLFLDLDKFKPINDTYGHETGDELLRQVAARLMAAVRVADIVARLGGDEFAMLQLYPPSPANGGVLAEKLLRELAQPFLVSEREVRISASIGIAVCPVDAASPDGLMKKADLALYHAKSAGRNCYRYYTEELDQIAHRKNADHGELKRVMHAQSFWLAYQPIVDKDGCTVAMEALLRLPGQLSQQPVEYVILLAQETGLLSYLGASVFRQACAQLRRWRDAGLHSVRICVNTCARELQDREYADQLAATMDDYHLGPGDVEVEITERDAIELERYGSTAISQLRDNGVLLSLDDFGTGYSSLSYLRGLPVTTIKLDKSFLRDVPDNDDANAVAKMVIQLAKELRLEVIAEGVERPEQATFLGQLGCDSYQGFLYSPAMKADEATAWLHAHAAH